MSKKEIELHFLPSSICGTDILGFHHSMKSIEASSSRATQKWWLVCVGVVLVTARDGWSPPVVASSAGSQCSSRDGALGWCRPLGGVGARCNHGVVRVQSVADTLSEVVGPCLLSTLLPPAKAPKHPSKPLNSRQDEMLCHRQFRVLPAYRRRPILDPLCLHRGVHVDHNQDQLIQLTVQLK
jgi:hypothetical protein